jgi:hypothetical protein
MDDTLFVDADGAETGVAATEVALNGISPQEIPLPLLRPDPAPIFTWAALPSGATADTAIILTYTLTDSSEAWARIDLRREGEEESTPAETVPALLPRGTEEKVEVRLNDLPEGSRWWIGAVVEDGLNTPFRIEAGVPVRISHRTERDFDLIEGVTLFTPTLDDPQIRSAHDWLACLPGMGELARWDIPTAAWIATARIADGTMTGEDFTLEPGIGYALVNAVSGSLKLQGPRRYAPQPVSRGAGLALLGISDSTATRSAAEILTDPAIVAVNRWDRHRQAWDGCFRLPDGERIGEDFILEWGEAVAVDIDTVTAWQPAFRAGSGPVICGVDRTVHAARTGTPTGREEHAFLAVPDGRQAIRLYWHTSRPASLHLERRNGVVVWQAPPRNGAGWQTVRIDGLAGGRYRAVLTLSGPDGDRRLLWQLATSSGGLPGMPRWGWGPAPGREGLLCFESPGGLRPVTPDGAGGWYVSLTEPTGEAADGKSGIGAQSPVTLMGFYGDGGWTRWPLVVRSQRSSLTLYDLSAPPLSLSGLEVEERGPQSITLRWQVLHGEEPLSFRIFCGYFSDHGGNGPPGDPRIWRPAAGPVDWEPGAPPTFATDVTMGPGPEGQAAPEAVAVRVTAEGLGRWLGPAALPVTGVDGGLALHPPVPNPFNPETTVRYTLPAGGAHTVRLEVRDVRGRLTKRLLDTSQPGGTWQVRWDGTDAAGARAAAGLYLLILEVDGRRTSRKVILLR